MEKLKQYMVIAVGCLECNSGKSDPEIVLMTDDSNEAKIAATERPYPGQEDRFIVNLVTGSLLILE